MLVHPPTFKLKAFILIILLGASFKIIGMKNPPGAIESLLENIVGYIETRIELMKLKTINKVSEVISSLVSVLVISIVLIFAVSILNIGLSIWIGTLLGNVAFGFFAVAGFYLIVALLLITFRSKWIKNPLVNIIIKSALK